MNQDIMPTFDNLLVKVIPKGETKTPGGIIIPQTSEGNMVFAEVMKVGPGKTVSQNGDLVDATPAMGAKVGDLIFINRHTAVQVDQINDDDFRIVKPLDVYAFIPKKESE